MKDIRLILVGLVVACTSCTGTPMPAPPIEPPPRPDVDRIVVEPPSPTSPGRISAGAGAVAPGAQLSVLNLDGMADAELVEPMSDGSFTFATELGTLRLEAVDAEGRRSAPLDINENGPVEVMLPCLVIPSQLDATASLQIDNECADTVTGQVQLRREGEYQVVAEDIEVLAGETTTIEVIAESGAGPDALLIYVESPLTERRAVTLF